MKKLPNFVKWLIIAVVLAAMAAMMVAVNDRASRVEMPMPAQLKFLQALLFSSDRLIKYSSLQM